MSRINRSLTCIICPMGCALEVVLEEGAVVEVKGNSCKRGEIYAKKECVAPVRMLTTTVRVSGGENPLVPVKTKEAIPKEMVFEAMKVLNKLTVKAPVSMGDVLVKDICSSGIDVAATGAVRKL